jgi:hypothetical protein
MSRTVRRQAAQKHIESMEIPKDLQVFPIAAAIQWMWRYCPLRLPDLSSGHSAESTPVPMNAKPPLKNTPAQNPPKTLQQQFSKWSLPFLFLAIGSVIGWALLRG